MSSFSRREQIVTFFDNGNSMMAPLTTEVTEAATATTCKFLEPELKPTKACGKDFRADNALFSKGVRTIRPSIRKNSVHRQGRRLLRRYHAWKSAHLYFARYSIEKLLAFETYQRLTSRNNAVMVILLTPFVALVPVLLLASIPLQDPLLPVASNTAYFVQSWLCYTVMTFGMLMYVRCALGLPKNIYSHQQCALISVLTSGASEIGMILFSLLWQFPVPLGNIIRIPTLMQTLVEMTLFLDSKFVVDGRQATCTALKIIESAVFPGALTGALHEGGEYNGITSTISHQSISVVKFPSDEVKKSMDIVKRSSKTTKVACIDQLTSMSLDIGTIELGDINHIDPELRSRSTTASSKREAIDDIEFAHRHHAKLLSQTLELLNASEVLVSSHYFDFSCSIIYGLYVLVVYHLPSVKYNLPFIGLSEEAFRRALLFHGILAAVTCSKKSPLTPHNGSCLKLTMLFDLMDPSSLLLPPPGKRHDKHLPQTPKARLQRVCRSVTDSTGTGFVYGTMFGSVLAVVEGMRAAPKEQRFRGALHHAKVFVPETAGRIAMVTCFFRVAAFGIEELRNKRDMWNTLLAAPVAGAMVKARYGPRAALNSAFVFGSFAAVVVGFNLAEAKVMHEKSSPEEVLEEIAFAEEFE
ncbi:unnamed protein product [Phytophthora lilii]|uniref:Unnamed protein product n=1 Tax=Phytophthora lilii TaxID=2077276 RepID=A0A9W6THU4_9STRA|nr:unnamed protein product [Phytophthora lilii]